MFWILIITPYSAVKNKNLHLIKFSVKEKDLFVYWLGPPLSFFSYGQLTNTKGGKGLED